MMLLVTMTSGRPKALEYLTKWVKKQTTNDYQWLIVSDDWEGYTWPKNATVLKRDNEDQPSINANWRHALDWLDKHDEFDKIAVFEDDDWYHREYLMETSAALDKADLVGWHEDAYYYVLSRKAKRFHNIGHASLAATAFTRAVLPWVRKCVDQNIKWIDLLLWKGIREKSLMAQPPITLGNNQVISPEPVPYEKLVDEWRGSRMLLDNFTGSIWGQTAKLTWDEHGKLTLVNTEPPLDEHGNIPNEHPRHVGMKEPWHRGKSGLSEFGHDPRMGGGPDIWGHKLNDWIGKEDAAWFLKLTKDPPRNPYPPNILLPLPID